MPSIPRTSQVAGRGAAQPTVDRRYPALSGPFVLACAALCVAGGISLIWLGFGVDLRGTARFDGSTTRLAMTVISLVVGIVLIKGLTVVQPRMAVVLTLFGRYHGTVSEPGFWWINPLTARTWVAVATVAEETKPIVVNDLVGNPITIAAMVTWRVDQAARAHFDVANYASFVGLQAEAALRHVASIHPYDRAEHAALGGSESDHADAKDQVTALRADREAIHAELVSELSERTKVAGVVIEEVRITHLAYAAEIAGAMLKRQQAATLIQAREMMVKGYVGIIRETIKALETGGKAGAAAITFTPEQKTRMTTMMLVTMIGERDATPVITVGHAEE